MSNNSRNFDRTAPIGWSLLKANIESAAFANEWNSEQKLQMLESRISGKALKFYKNRSYTVQSDYELLCKLFNNRFDSVGYPCLILENLENIFSYPDELFDEFTDRIEELVERSLQNVSENAKEHVVKKYLTNACCDEEGNELVKAVTEGSVYEAKSYLCVLEDTNLKMEKDGRPQSRYDRPRNRETVRSEETIGKVPNVVPEYHPPSCHSKDIKEDSDYTMKTMESLSPKYKSEFGIPTLIDKEELVCLDNKTKPNECYRVF
ncbi:unnamed protein product [Mytilus coruscus]|uniref:Uncharacterized protein n=1 Tax=Mytilus coruscus TaxID=42192 RepID=A0A6J8EPA6_MYTCO|nr:unnamed protein product [Mytilus coruscus]